MEQASRIERALTRSIGPSALGTGPAPLVNAMGYGVFPGGARVRPRLCLAVAEACGDDEPGLADAAAVAVELMHCASLVHDDLPVFDDAEVRRGKASVHRRYGAPLALLTGDALIVRAFEVLGIAGLRRPDRLARLVVALGRATGAEEGLCAGQAFEADPDVPLEVYQRAKTGALFIAASTMGAAAAGADPSQWDLLGDKLGEAYQIADDIRDVAGDAEELGKPIGQDLAHGRPNAVHRLGLTGALARLDQLVADAVNAIPPCAGWSSLRDLVLSEKRRLVPKGLAHYAA